MAEDLSVLGSPSYLQSAGELGIGMQRNKLAQQQQNTDAVNKAGALPKAIATQGVEQQMSKITIDDNLAKGLAKMTGQDWSSSVGTKWDPKVFTPMVTGMAQAKYHSDLLNDHDKLEQMKEDAAAKKQKDEDDAKAKRQADEDKAKKDREDKALKNKKDIAGNKGTKTQKEDSSGAWFKKMQDSGKALVAAQQKKGGLPATGLAANIKNKVLGQDPGDAAKIGSLKQMVMEYRTAKDNYNKKAQAEGLAPQPADPASDAAMDALTGHVTQQENLQKQPNATTTKLPGLE